MRVTRRQSVLTIVTVLGGALIGVLRRRRPTWTPGDVEGRRDPLGQAAAGRSSRRVDPAPHSVKRHG